MSKLRIASLIFLAFAIVFLVALGLEIYGDLDPTRIQIFAILTYIGLIGSCTCTFIRAVIELQKKHDANKKSD